MTRHLRSILPLLVVLAMLFASASAVAQEDPPVIQLDEPDPPIRAIDQTKDETPPPPPPAPPPPDPRLEPERVIAELEAKLAGGEELTPVEQVDLVGAHAARIDSPGEGLAMLWLYFRITGIVSVICWSIAISIVVVYVLLAAWAKACGRHSSDWALGRVRSLALGIALVLALSALLFGRLNSNRVNKYEADRTKELILAKDRAERQVQELKKDAADVTFAEDTDADRADLAGLTDEEREKLESAEASLKSAEEGLETQPLYRQTGRVDRDADSQRPESEAPRVVKESGETDESLRMHELHVVRANTWDRANLTVVRGMWRLVLVLIVLDYLSRFNRTVGHVCPIPLGGRIMDRLFPKRHLVHVHAASPDGLVRFIEDSIRKGESVIYLGPRLPALAQRLPRVPLFDQLGMEPQRGPLAGVPVMRYSSSKLPHGWTFVFESAWFGRYVFAFEDVASSMACLREIVERLAMRYETQASAWGTVNLIWAFDEPMPDVLVRELLALGPEANFRLLCIGDRPCTSAIRERTQETISLESPANVRRLVSH